MPPPRSRSPSPARELWDSALARGSEAVRGVAQHVAQQVSAQVVATASPVAAARCSSWLAGSAAATAWSRPLQRTHGTS